MDIIRNNPYRILGLLAGATTREQTKQINTLNKYLSAEQEPPEDFSFPILGAFNRTTATVSNAVTQLSLDKDKIQNALFWFYNGNAQTDELAFTKLKGKDINSCIKIWENEIDTNNITSQNYSAYQNLSTLLLLVGFNNERVTYTIAIEGILKKIKFIESDFFDAFKEKLIGTTHNITNAEIELFFLESVRSELSKQKNFSFYLFIDALKKQNSNGTADYLKKLAQREIVEIEKEINKAKSKRSANKKDSANAGSELYDKAKTNLKQLLLFMDEADIRYASISDKVAQEILQCGIDSFQYYQETNPLQSNNALDLLTKAETLATGNITKTRCKANIENIKNRIEEEAIKDELEKLKNEIEICKKSGRTIDSAKNLLDRCKPILTIVKRKSINNNELYLRISTNIAGLAMHHIIEEVNRKQENFQMSSDPAIAIYTLKDVIEKAWNAILLVASLDMESDFRNHYNKNKATLKNLCAQLGVDTHSLLTLAISPAEVERLKKQRESLCRPVEVVYIPPEPSADYTGWIWAIVLVIIIIISFII
jgi:predicted  nucleic acid-binding Zn-ribbon protein